MNKGRYFLLFEWWFEHWFGIWNAIWILASILSTIQMLNENIWGSDTLYTFFLLAWWKGVEDKRWRHDSGFQFNYLKSLVCSAAASAEIWSDLQIRNETEYNSGSKTRHASYLDGWMSLVYSPNHSKSKQFKMEVSLDHFILNFYLQNSLC